jgi:hypothetical protein
MSLFSFGDIRITNESRSRASSSLGIGEDYNIMTFPLDIGSYDKGHYLVIHVNKQIKSAFGQKSSSQDEPTIIANRKKLQYSTSYQNISSIASDIGGFFGKTLDNSKKSSDSVSGKVNALNDPTGAIGGGLGVLKNFYETASSQEFGYRGARTIERSLDTIVLYMPDTLNFTQNQNYPGMELGKSMLSGLAAAGTTLMDVISGKISGGETARNLTPFIGAAAQMSSQPLFVAAAVGIQGMVLNPQLELIYSSPDFRTFRFDFMLYPRSKKEAAEVQKILEKLRFHHSPEVDTTTKGFFMVPPSEFDIKFYYNGKENPNIPKISTCVMTALDVDYAPNGFAAYEEFENNNPEVGGTGMPVGIRLSMEFKETEIMLKNHYAEPTVNQEKQPPNPNAVPGPAAISPNDRIGPNMGIVNTGDQVERSGGGYVPESTLKYEAPRDITFPKIFDNNDQYLKSD